jgi:hypothetical protein
MQNNVTVIYTQVEQGVLPLAGLVLCPIISLLCYLYVNKLLRRTETLTHRAELFYVTISGVLLGQFVCLVFFKVVDNEEYNRYVTILVLFGVFVMECIQRFARVCNANPLYVAPPRSLSEEEAQITLNRRRDAENEYVQMEDASDESVPNTIFTTHDIYYDNMQRYRILVVMCIVMTFVATIDGLFLIYNAPTTPTDVGLTVFAFYINKALQSICVFGAMTHAKLHWLQGRRKKIVWGVFTCAWSLIVFCSTLPVIIGTTYDDIAIGVESFATIGFYSFSGGVMLWLSQYFNEQRAKQTERGDTLKLMSVFGMSLLLSWITGMFFNKILVV